MHIPLRLVDRQVFLNSKTWICKWIPTCIQTNSNWLGNCWQVVIHISLLLFRNIDVADSIYVAQRQAFSTYFAESTRDPDACENNLTCTYFSCKFIEIRDVNQFGSLGIVDNIGILFAATAVTRNIGSFISGIENTQFISPLGEGRIWK